MVGAKAEIFEKLEPEPEPHKNGPPPQHWVPVNIYGTYSFSTGLSKARVVFFGYYRYVLMIDVPVCANLLFYFFKASSVW
jgi:hypothetical protein